MKKHPDGLQENVFVNERKAVGKRIGAKYSTYTPRSSGAIVHSNGDCLWTTFCMVH
jgi:hypothetical protein